MRTAPEEKSVLNPTEAINVFGLSARRFYQMLSNGKKKPFLVFYNKRKLILRREFELFLDDNPEIKEALKNGKPKSVKAERLETPGASLW